MTDTLNSLTRCISAFFDRVYRCVLAGAQAQSLSENQSQERKGVSSLLEKAKHFAGDEAGGKDKDKGKDKGKGKEDDKSPPPKCGGKISGFFKKIKNATGFSDDPPGRAQ